MLFADSSRSCSYGTVRAGLTPLAPPDGSLGQFRDYELIVSAWQRFGWRLANRAPSGRLRIQWNFDYGQQRAVIGTRDIHRLD